LFLHVILVIRENTEGEYISLEHQFVPAVVETLKSIKLDFI
jgi:isocitrate/isopropylmalate dehydrogenase